MLQLILEGGQGYEDLAGLLGIEVEEVRERARGITAALGAAEIDRGAPATDFILGQAEPREAEAALESLAADPAALSAAKRLTAQLRLLAPDAELPALPKPGATPAPATPAPQPTAAAEAMAKPAPAAAEPPPIADEPSPAAVEPSTPEVHESPGAEHEAPGADMPTATVSTSLSLQQKRLLAALVGAGLVVVAIALGVAGVFGGDEDSGATSAGGPTGANGAAGANGGASNGEQTAGGEQAANGGETAAAEQITRAVLSPQNGGEARGVAIFGLLEDQPVLQVTAEGLEPTGSTEEYSVWLYRDDEILLRLAGVAVNNAGQIATQLDLPEEALAFIGDEQLNAVDISRNSRQAYREELNRSREANRLPRHVGTSVLRGPITGPGLGGEPLPNG